jgi:hypothetical protein
MDARETQGNICARRLGAADAAIHHLNVNIVSWASIGCRAGWLGGDAFFERYGGSRAVSENTPPRAFPNLKDEV